MLLSTWQIKQKSSFALAVAEDAALAAEAVVSFLPMPKQLLIYLSRVSCSKYCLLIDKLPKCGD